MALLDAELSNYPRDLRGYGEHRPHPEWPGDARIAVQFVLNYEEGGENSILHGDKGAEQFLADMVPAPERFGARHMSVESIYEYGPRAGIWRILQLFEERGWPLTIFAVATALGRYPELATRLSKGGHEIACHGNRWIDHQDLEPQEEEAQIRDALATIEDLVGERMVGWYTGRTSPNTLRLISQMERIAYCADDYSDDLPFWDYRWGSPLLMVPYALDTNDMRFSAAHGFANAQDYFDYLKDSFDTLYAEGSDRPAMMSVGMHCRLVGRPGRFSGLQKFVDYVASHEDVWICRRIDIAEHWQRHFPHRENKA